MKRTSLLSMPFAALLVLCAATAASGMYHPTLGRFVQRDPVGYADSTNLYETVNANPINRVDPSGESGCCGPEVGKQLRLTLKQVETDWNSWGYMKRLRKCLGMTNWNVEPSPWDIDKLKYPSNILREGPCATGTCEDTVAVDGVCYNAKQVNYALWGKINRLCSRNLSGTVGLAAVYKGFNYLMRKSGLSGGEPFELRNAGEAMGWTVAGWTGMDKVGILPPSFHKECIVSKDCKCLEPESPWPYTWNEKVDAGAAVSAEVARQATGQWFGGLDVGIEPDRRIYDTVKQSFTDATGALNGTWPAD